VVSWGMKNKSDDIKSGINDNGGEYLDFSLNGDDMSDDNENILKELEKKTKALQDDLDKYSSDDISKILSDLEDEISDKTAGKIQFCYSYCKYRLLTRCKKEAEDNEKRFLYFFIIHFCA